MNNSDQTIDQLRQHLYLRDDLRLRLSGIRDRDTFIQAALEVAGELNVDVSFDQISQQLSNRQQPHLNRLPSDLSGWYPQKINWKAGIPNISWCYMAEHPFSEPFYADSFTRHGLCALNQFLHFETLLQAIEPWAIVEEIAPSGFIFHMSRCGSTLVSQVLSALPVNLCYSEPEPLDAVLRARLQHPEITEAQQIQWLQALINLWGRRRSGREQHLFIKTDCWHIAAFPLLQKAFPGVPMIFLYRDPVEVLVSHQKQRGMQMVPGLIEAEWLSDDISNSPPEPLDAYGAWVLGNICRMASEHCAKGSMLTLNYQHLPDAIWNCLSEYFGIRYQPDEIEIMRAAAGYNAKAPRQSFSSDSQRKQDAASDNIRSLARIWVAPYCDILENP